MFVGDHWLHQVCQIFALLGVTGMRYEDMLALYVLVLYVLVLYVLLSHVRVGIAPC